MWLLKKKIHFPPIRKNPHGRILKGEPKEQHLSTILKSCLITIKSSKSIADQPLLGFIRRNQQKGFSQFHMWLHYSAPCFGYTMHHLNLMKSFLLLQTQSVVLWKPFTLPFTSLLHQSKPGYLIKLSLSLSIYIYIVIGFWYVHLLQLEPYISLSR